MQNKTDKDNQVKPASEQQVKITWTDGKTTVTDKAVIDKYFAMYGENPNYRLNYVLI